MAHLSVCVRGSILNVMVAVFVSVCMTFSVPVAFAQEPTAPGDEVSKAIAESTSSSQKEEASVDAADVSEQQAEASAQTSSSESSSGEKVVSSNSSAQSSADTSENASSSDASSSTSVEEAQVTAQAEEPEAVVQSSKGDNANVVVVARFAGDTLGDGATGFNAPSEYNPAYTEYDRLKANFDQAEGYYGARYSLAKYVSDVSGGQAAVKNYYPQASGNTTAYVTLPMTQAQYQNEFNPEYAMVRDVIKGFDEQYSGSTAGWDADNDGSIDNLEIIVQVGESISVDNQMLWPHKYNLGQPSGCSINGMNVNIYNVINSEAVDDGATAAHEYLHSLGLGDLYRLGALTTEAGFENANTPVGIWDIMAKAGFEFPLAQSRQDLGWGNIPEVTDEGTYTLTVPYSESGRNAFKVASPYSSDEYFVFEYRKKATDPLTQMTTPDKYISNSGLLVYRVNNGFGAKNNKTYDESGSYYRDYLYVFRPGETGLHNSAGNTMESCLSLGDAYAPPSTAGSQHSSFGTANASDPITAGTICDSLGRNSLIQVKVTAQDDNSVTFSLTIPETTEIDMWNQVGSFDTEGLGNIATAAGDDGSVYVVDKDASANYNVFKYAADGTKTSLGAAFKDSNGSVPMLTVANGVLYCAIPKYPTSNASVEVKKYTGGSWVSVGSVATGSAYAMTPKMTTLNNKPYLMVDKNNTSMQLYEVGSSSLTKVGSEITGNYIIGTSLGLLDGNIVVSYGDFNMGNPASSALKVAKLSGGTWSEIGSVQGKTRVTSLASTADGTLLLLDRVDDTNPRIFTVTSSGLSSPKTVTGPTTAVDSGLGLVVNDEWAYVMTSQPDAGLGIDVARVWASKIDDLSSWQKVGEDAVAPSGSATFCTTDTKLYVAAENSNTYKGTLASHAVMEKESPAPQPVDIAGATIAAIPDQTVTGAAIEPDLTVTIDGKTLVKGTDYTVAYSNNTSVGTATATITGKGDYTGTKSATFEIVAAAQTITKVAKPTAKTGLIYNGSSQTGVAAATAYTVTGGSATNAGNYTATASLKDKAATAWSDGTTADVKVPYTIAKKSIAKPTAKTGLIYNGSSQVGVAAVAGYKVTGGSAVNAGNHSATASLADKVNTQWFGGTSSKDITVPFSIARANLAGAKVSASNCTYTGAALTPVPTVTLNGKKLPATDYTTSYTNNKNVGTATVTVTGKGNYIGSASGHFSIKAATPTITPASAPLNVKAVAGTKQITVSWSAPSSNGGSAVTSYNIYRNGVQVGSVKAPSTSFTDKNLADSTRYSYTVAAVNSKGAGARSASVSSTTKAAAVPKVQYQTHVQNVGWQGWVSDGAMSGTSGRSLRLEGIKIKETGISDLGIQYRTHIQNIGWESKFKNDNVMSGTSGKSLRLEAIQIKLTGAQASKYDVFYRVHAQDVGWMGWAKNGDSAGTAGYSKRLEGIQIVIMPKGSKPGVTYKGITAVDTHPCIDSSATNGKVSYNATMHIQNKGNTNFSTSGSKFLGTTGSALRVEALTITKFNAPTGANLGVRYRTHIQNIGWESSWKSVGQTSGTSGRSLRLEALQLELTGADKGKYDIYYRTHIQNIGWTGWAKNGQQCGSAGYAYRMEAMQIVVVPKDGTAPGINSGFFYKR